MKNTIIIGAGRMGRRHIEVCKKLNLNLVGLIDISIDSLDIAKKEHNLSDNILFLELDSLLKKLIPECVIIATTADSHCDLTIKLSEMGVKYILVEKPMATSVEDSNKMISICEKNNTKLAVNHQMEFLDQYISPKNLLNNTDFGGFTSMTVIAGNIGFSMNALHFFEAFRFLTNEEPDEVTAWFADQIVANPRGAQFEDRAGSIRVVSKSGKRLYMEIGSDQGNGLIVNYFARNGNIVIDELTGDMRTYLREEKYLDLPTTRYGMPSNVNNKKINAVEIIDSTASVLSNLFNNVNNESALNGLSAVKVLVAAYESAENLNKAIKISNLTYKTKKFPWA
jgi:predicted dehydrogenase